MPAHGARGKVHQKAASKSAKKSKSLDEKVLLRAIRLAQGKPLRSSGVRVQKLLGKLYEEYSGLVLSSTRYPQVEQLRSQIGCSRTLIEAAIPLAQGFAAKSKQPPLVLAGTQLESALVNLGELARSVLGPLFGSQVDTPSGEAAANRARALGEMVSGSSLPALPLLSESKWLSIDDSLVRCEVWWVHVVCMSSSQDAALTTVLAEAQRKEELWASLYELHDPSKNPFKGFAQALTVAKQSGRLSRYRYDAICHEVETAADLAHAYATSRGAVRELALQCGFPPFELRNLLAVS